MILYPDIAVKDGKCVTLRRGQMTQPHVYADNVVAKAKEFVDNGAEWLNVVDLDAVARGQADNSDLIVELINSVPVPVQVGGGIRKIEHVNWWIARGAECVVIAGAAVLNPHLVAKACTLYPYRVLVSVDVWQGKVVVNGWTRPTEYTPLGFARMFDRLALAGIIVTDIDYEINLPDSSFALVTDMARKLSTPVIASGMVKTPDDLSTLKYLEIISGAIVGRALHQGHIRLSEALSLVREPKRELVWRGPNSGRAA